MADPYSSAERARPFVGVDGKSTPAFTIRMDGHVLVLAASIRKLEHLLACFHLGAELVTVPAKILGD